MVYTNPELTKLAEASRCNPRRDLGDVSSRRLHGVVRILQRLRL